MTELRTDQEQRSIDTKIARLRARLSKAETLPQALAIMKAIVDLLDDEL